MEEINTWQKREKETGVPSHWPESGEDAGLAFRVLGGVASAGDAAANESKKKEKIGSGPGRDWETPEEKVRGPEIREL